MSIAETTTNVIKRNRELIISHYKVVQEEMESVLFHEEFIDAAIQIILTIISFKDTQEGIIDVISDVHHERINNLLFTVNQLDEQLQRIQNSLPSHLDLPTRQVIQLYRLLKVKAGVLEDKIIFEIKIPLMEREEFQIMNAISVPTLHSQQFVYIKPSASYIFVSLQRTTYYLATEMDFQSCQLIKQQQYMCNIHGPLLNIKSVLGSCELGLLRHESEIPASCNIRSTLPTIVWIQLHMSNSWIFSTDKTYTFDNICNNTIIPITISGSGVLQLPAHCSLKGDTFMLYSRASYTTYMNKSFIPVLNLTKHIINQKLPITTDNSDIKYLENSINDAKKGHRSPLDINDHDIHHYTITYTLFIMIIMISIYILWKRRYSQYASQDSPAPLQTTAV